MIPSSALLREAALYSQTLGITVDILRGNTVVVADVPVVEGKIDADRSSKARMSSDITIAGANYPDVLLDLNVNRFRVKRGWQSLGVAESIQHGIFRVDDLEEHDDGTLVVSGSGLESYIIDARFLQPRTPPYGSSTVGHITTLIKEVLPNAVVSVECTSDKAITATAPWERERWDAIDALANSINVEVFADYRGYFVIRDIPNLTTSLPVYRLSDGDDGVLIERTPKKTRDRVYNAVSVSGQSSDQDIPPVWGWAADMDPNSPTYYYGDFGQVPRFFSSQFFTTEEQCTAYAQTLLADALAANESLSGTALPLMFLEPDDIIDIVMASGQVERRILEKMSYSLGTDASVSFETKLVKDLTQDET
jgi:hypothetical protein